MDDSIDPIEHLRNLRLEANPIEYGESPSLALSPTTPAGMGFGIFIFVAIGSFIGYLAFGRGFWESFGRGFSCGVLAAFAYLLWPILSFFIWLIIRKKYPDANFVKTLSSSQKWFTCIALSFALTVGIDIATLKIFKWWKISHPLFHYQAHHIYMVKGLIGGFGAAKFFALWGSVFIVLGLLLMILFSSQISPSQIKPQRSGNKNRQKPPKIDSEPFFSLWVGHSTGWLSSLHHGAGIAPDQQIALNLEDAAQNILVLGAIGSGKTNSVMHPLLLQLLDQDCGGLIFDIKGDFQTAVLAIAKALNREITIIGVNQCKMNLLAGLTPEVASSFLKSIFTLNAHHQTDTFWLDTAVELCRNALGVLSFLPEHYSLSGLYAYLFDLEARNALDEQITKLQLSNDLPAPKKRLLNAYWQYHERIFDKFDEKVKAGVNATIAQVLSPFNHPDLIDAFCTEDQDNTAMEEVLNGAVYLVDMPLSIWGLGGKVVYTLIKLRFFNVMQKRVAEPEWNQERPVFFMCDEFQEIVSANKDGISDLNFWDKSRSSKTIGIISAQAISSFYAAIGDRDVANALLQNFRQKICFKTEDTTTLNYFHSLADKVEVAKITHSKTTSNSKHSGSFGSSASDSHTESITYTDKPVLDAQLFRALQPQQALALLSIGGKSMDDVLTTFAIYI